jgi:hypothetical protein
MIELPHVLCFSRDPLLLKTRVAVLERQYRVVPVGSLAEILELPFGSTFDLVVLCHTVSDEDCRNARAFIKARWPSAKVLSMTTGSRSCGVEQGEIIVRGLDGPPALLQRIDSLLHATM